METERLVSESRHIAFVCPRFSTGDTVGGAETLLGALARRAAAAGRKVSFLTTCARNHFTWENEHPPGTRTIDGIEVTFFPVDSDRDIDAFLKVQRRISRGADVDEEAQLLWLQNSVNSRALYDHLREHGQKYDRIVTGPYLFGLTWFAARIHPQRTLLLPCLHDEPFARLSRMADLFAGVRRCIYNTAPEQELAERLYGRQAARGSVVGIGMTPFESDPEAFARSRGLASPYIIYCGRREPLKGTPLLLDYFRTFRERTCHDLKLVLTGTGPLELRPSDKDHVFDAGFVGQQEKYDAMAGATVFCHPSTNESLGIVLLESWLAGTPCLVHAGSAVLTDQCRRSGGGMWFRNYPEFEEEMSLLLESPDIGRAMAGAGNDYVRDSYAWKRIDGLLLEALDRPA